MPVLSLVPVPRWFREIVNLPKRAPTLISEFSKVLLIGIGMDGAQILASIVKTLMRYYPDSDQWARNIMFVAVGVEEVEALPRDIPDEVITLQLEASPSFFRTAGVYPDGATYLDWWYSAGRPTSGRGLARLALFSNLKDGFANTPLYNLLVQEPKNRDIKYSYVLTSLNDPVGTALMWDILHLLNREASEEAHLSVLWLALSGNTQRSGVQSYAWHELQRLGMGGNITAQYNQNDWQRNIGHIRAGASRNIIVGNSQDDLRWVESATNSIDLLADIVSWTLDPAFFRYFVENWLASVPSRGLFLEDAPLSLNISSIGGVTFYIPVKILEELCIWRLILDIFWNGVTIDIGGMFSQSEMPYNEGRKLALQFLCDIRHYGEFFNALAKIGGGHNDVINLTSKTLGDVITLYKEQLLVKLDLILNGDERERDQIRSCHTAKIDFSRKFVSELDQILSSITFNLLSNDEYQEGIKQAIWVIQDFTHKVRDELDIWVDSVGIGDEKKNVNNLRSIVEMQLLHAREKLRTVYREKVHHRILLNSNYDENQFEETIYQQWKQYLVAREQPGRSDPLSIMHSRLGWLFEVDRKHNSLIVKFCIADHDAKHHQEIALEYQDLPTIANKFYALVRQFSHSIFDGSEIESSISEQQSFREFPQLVQCNGSPIMVKGNHISSSHVLGAKESYINRVASSLSSSGLNVTRHVGNTNPNRFGVISIRDRVDLSQLFVRPVRTRRKSDYIFTAEQAYFDFEAKIQLKFYDDSHLLRREFVYFLSDPILARYFGLGLLHEFIRLTKRGGYFEYAGKRFQLGKESKNVLFYVDHPMLAAMEDFVIEQPGNAQLSHPLHPRNRAATLRFYDQYINEVSSREDNAKRLRNTFDKIKMALGKETAYQELAHTCFAWLSLLRDEVIE